MQINPQRFPYTQLPDSFNIPAHDTQVVDETNPNSVTVTYKKSGVTVAVKTIAISGSVTTISVVYS